MFIRISPDIQVVINVPGMRVDSVCAIDAPNFAALRAFFAHTSGWRLKLPLAPASITAGALE